MKQYAEHILGKESTWVLIPRVPVATIKPENLPQLRIWLRKGVFVMPEARVVVRVDASRMPVRRTKNKKCFRKVVCSKNCS
jgi:hypothetical protein